jgi:hypothetical protein
MPDRIGVAFRAARFGPGATRSPLGQAALSIDCRREPARAALTIEFASPARCPVLSPRRHGLYAFRPSGGSAREGGGREPRAVDQIGARSPGRWGDAVEVPALQSKPVAPASRLVARVAPSVASGLGLSILAAGPARDSHYSYRERLCDRRPQSRRNAIRERVRGGLSATPTRWDRRSADQPDNAVAQSSQFAAW